MTQPPQQNPQFAQLKPTRKQRREAARQAQAAQQAPAQAPAPAQASTPVQTSAPDHRWAQHEQASSASTGQPSWPEQQDRPEEPSHVALPDAAGSADGPDPTEGHESADDARSTEGIDAEDTAGPPETAEPRTAPVRQVPASDSGADGAAQASSGYARPQQWEPITASHDLYPDPEPQQDWGGSSRAGTAAAAQPLGAAGASSGGDRFGAEPYQQDQAGSAHAPARRKKRRGLRALLIVLGVVVLSALLALVLFLTGVISNPFGARVSDEGDFQKTLSSYASDEHLKNCADFSSQLPDNLQGKNLKVFACASDSARLTSDSSAWDQGLVVGVWSDDEQDWSSLLSHELNPMASAAVANNGYVVQDDHFVLISSKGTPEGAKKEFGGKQRTFQSS